MANSLWWVCVCSVLATTATAQTPYFGKSLGKLSELHHAVSGHVYAVDGRTLFIKDFTYDGDGPAAYFYVGNGKSPSNVGAQRLRDERGSTGVLKRYRGKDITLTLPEGKTFNSIKWFAIWCDEFSVNFGDVKIPRTLDYPKPQKISGLSGVHGVSSDPIVVVDAQTLLIPNFSYDGEAPDAKFWVGRGDKPSPQGIRIPDENGKVSPLMAYVRKTIVLTLPGDLTVFDIGHFGVWCEAFTVDFGHIKVPAMANVPPSLKMLGVSPQSKLNCEVLYDDLAFEVRWAVAGESVVIQLVAKLEDGEYMSFGLSGEDDHSRMVGADVAVAWVDKTTLKGYASDYYLDAKSQCAGTRGSCPDERLSEKTNSVRLLNAAMVNGYSIVTYQRPLRASDELDKAVFHDKPQPIVWAVGPLNSRKEVSYHTHFTKEDRLLDFGRPPAWNCPMPEMDDVGEMTESVKRNGGRPVSVNNGQYLVETTSSADRGVHKFMADYDSDISATGYKEQATRKPRPVPTPKPASKNNAWVIPPINCDEPDDGVFYAQMGPTGGKQGYPAITGHVGWGISWYINGLLIPEINVVRGKTYTFVTEGGRDPDVPARYHPFYISDDPVGGYEHKTPEERSEITIFAGVRQSRNGQIIPTGVGRLCTWTPDINGPGADEYASFGAYQRSLTLLCDPGEPEFITWTPDNNTPDTVYYQCFTHRYLGWKINVLDSCDVSGQASERKETYTSPDSSSDDDMSGDDLVSRPSIRVATRVKPDNSFAEQQKDPSKASVKQSYSNSDNHNLINHFGNRVMIREIGNKTKNNIVIGESVNRFVSDSKMVSPESNPRPNLSVPVSQGQYKQAIDSVEKYESKQNNQHDESFDRHPVYHHSTPSSGGQGNSQDRPNRNNDEFVMDIKNIPSHLPSPSALQNNQKPMTLQTFMRPHGKPMMGNNVYFRRPMHPDMRHRRPGMQKPMMNMPSRMPPPYMMGQPNFMSQHKIFKMPPVNRPPINGFGRPVMPMKQLGMNHNGMGQKYNGHPPAMAPGQSGIILGKPSLISQTLTLGQPTIIGQQGTKNHMSLPSEDETPPQQLPTDTYFNKPGQIIMGKPMDNPIPLDQQMLPTKHHLSYTNLHSAVTTPITHTSSDKVDIVHAVPAVENPSRGSASANITPSELINSSADPAENQITMLPAVNTGFKPDSVVIEGGFKPIIREPLLSGEDRITDYDDESVVNNRRSDADTDTESADESNNQLPSSEFYEKQLTESFEPMFIPSPPDRHVQKFQNNSTNDDKRLEYLEIGPRPVYVFPEIKEKSSENNNKKTSDDMTMAADRVDAYYLPPNHKTRPVNDQPDDIELPAGTVVSYDGRKVLDTSLASPAQKNAGGKIYSSKLSSNSELLTKTPQFGPFKGEIPSLIQGQIGSGQVTKLQSVSNSHNYPGSLGQHFNNNGPSKATHLTLVNSFDGDDEKKNSSDIEYDGSENHEEIYDEVKDDDEDEIKRLKREAHHTPEHTDNPDHDHSQHDHSQHDHSQHSGNSSESSQKSTSSSDTYSLSRTHLLLLPICILSTILV